MSRFNLFVTDDGGKISKCVSYKFSNLSKEMPVTPEPERSLARPTLWSPMFVERWMS
jgi:hypothetical protein